MKRFWIVLLALCLLCGMIACRKPNAERTAEEQPQETPAPEPDPTPVPVITPEPTAKPIEAPTPEPAPEPVIDPGEYGIVAYEVEGVRFEGEQLSATGIDRTYIELNEDGTGTLVLMETEIAITWEPDGTVLTNGQPYSVLRRIDAETVTLDYANAVLTLMRGVMPKASETPAPETEPTPAPEPETTPEPENIAAEPLYPGAPYGASDGMIDRATLAGLYHWMHELPGGFLYSLTFDEIGEAAGKQGRDNRNNDGRTHSANWCDAENDSITVTFKDRGDGVWTCCAIAIVGILSDEYNAADISGFPKIASSTPAGTNPTESATFELKVGFSDTRATVTAAIPTANWYAKERSGSVRIYCAPSEEKAESSQSYILIECKESEDKINFYLSSFENLETLEPLSIGGIEMQGRTYDNIGMHWIEYYGEIEDGVWVSIRMSGVDFSAGTETEAIVTGLTFGTK